MGVSMPEREGKNRVCGCKVLLHHTHTTSTHRFSPSTHMRALYSRRTDGGIGRRTVWPINRRLDDWRF